MGKVELILAALVLILLLLGAKKLPELARGVGESVRELKHGFNDDAPSSGSKKTDAASTEEK